MHNYFTGMELPNWNFPESRSSVERKGKAYAVEAEPPSAGLLVSRLPVELRLQIYHLLIPRKRIVQSSSPDLLMRWPYRELNHPLSKASVQSVDMVASYAPASSPRTSGDPSIRRRNRNRNSIFLLSKHISDEALGVLYGENVYLCRLNRGGDTKLKENFTENNIKKMRYLVLIVESTGLSYTPRQAPAIEFWASIVTQLKGLRIVANQPSSAMVSHPIAGPILKEDLEMWIAWLRLFLGCFAKYLPNDAVLEIDVNDRADTRKIFDECVAGRYREVRCRLVGHLMFRRGRWKSGLDWENHRHGRTDG